MPHLIAPGKKQGKGLFSFHLTGSWPGVTPSSLPLSSICYFINLGSNGRCSQFRWNSGLIWCVGRFIPYSEGGDVNTLTGLVFSLRNICTLWWRFLMMRFLFWTQIWWCHSRQGPLQECLTWWLNRPQGECVSPRSVPALTGCGMTSISPLTLELIFWCHKNIWNSYLLMFP